MDLLESVRRWVLRNLPYPNGPDVIAALNDMGPRSLLVLYLNWCERLIPIEPRLVLRSSAFDKNPIVEQQGETISQIIEDIECGRDLTKYLSRRVTVGFDLLSKPHKKDLNRLQHLDLLLNDWGIYHLHISMNVEADRFVARGGPLLFAIFKPFRAYLIDLKSHNDFANDDLLRIVLTTWPNDGLLTELKGILGPRQGRRPSQGEREMLRSAGLSTLFQSDDGRIFSTGTGISTAGTTDKASIMSGRILRTLKKFDESVKSNPTEIIEFIRQHAGNPPDAPEFEFSFFQNGYGVIETRSGTPIRLGA
ncbi:MAG: hypothetical protein ACREC1_07910 [Methylovirgula sp.]